MPTPAGICLCLHIRLHGNQGIPTGPNFSFLGDISNCHELALAQALRQWWTSPPFLSLWANSSGLPGSQSVGPGIPSFGWPEESEGQLGRVPGSLREDSRAGSWDLALRELPTELCFLLARTGTLDGEHCALGPCPFLLGQRITFAL